MKFLFFYLNTKYSNLIKKIELNRKQLEMKSTIHLNILRVKVQKINTFES